MAEYTGDCLCGAVAFRIEGEPEPIQVCHCSQCRKAQGTPFATNMPVARAAFHLLRGEDCMAEFESSPGKRRVFCKRCGSPLYSCKDSLPDVLRVRAGLINEPLAVRPAAHIYTDSKCNWWAIDDALPQFPHAYTPGTDAR